ncbi:putative hydrolase [Mycobacterium xenopi 3993]|nr:putative hydrolase [Mycobacterium xenopi 3993]
MLSDDELAGLSEFALLAENAEQAGVDGPLPSVERVDAGAISALRWGEARRGWCSCTAADRTRTLGTPSSWAWASRRWRWTFPATAVRPGATTATTRRGATPPP